MKNFILAVFCLTTATSYASECFVVETCLKNVPTCSLRNKPTYNSFSGIVYHQADLRYEWAQTIECVHFNGKKTRVQQSDVGVASLNSSILVEELRIPATLKDVQADYLLRAKIEAEELCEDQKQQLINSSKYCL